MAAVDGPSLPPEDTMSRPSSAKSDTSLSEYNFEWLFDPHRMDHLPIEEQLNYYKQRDLKKTKAYKFAVKIWGAPQSRKRKIIAGPMDRGQAGQPHLPVSIHSSPITAPLKPHILPPKMPSDAEVRARQERDKIDSYERWIQERRSFRNNLESMGLNEEWLARKPDRTALEQRVLNRMIAARNPCVPTPPPKEDPPLEAILPDESPMVRRPSPLAIRIIEKFLRQKKMRLIDLFQSVDKDKDWRVTREEFRKAIHLANIPISEVLLEDLILALDTDLNNELDYRELAKGMGLWKIEKRESKRKLLSGGTVLTSPTKYSQMSGFDPPDMDPELERMERELSKSTSSPFKFHPSPYQESPAGFIPGQTPDGALTLQGSPSRLKSALSTISSGSGSQFLEVPEGDMRQEQMLLGSDEAMVDVRKRDKETLSRYNSVLKSQSPGKSSLRKGTSSNLQREHSSNSEAVAPNRSMIILTGDVAIDNHCKPSTLGGETAELVDRFRQMKLKEFDDICKMCKEKSVPFTEELLKKVLLFPPDRAHTQISHTIRQPAQPLLPANFATEAKNKKRGGKGGSKSPTSGDQAKTSRGSKARKGGRFVYGDNGASQYPTAKSTAAKEVRVLLSTGKATIARQVNCWMTFEEYERLTSHLAQKYTHIHGKSDSNAFWPGQLLDKLRLCMPDAPPRGGAIFAHVHQKPRSNVGYHNDLNTWPSGSGYVQYGNIDKTW